MKLPATPRQAAELAQGRYLAELKLGHHSLQALLLCCQVPKALLRHLQVPAGAHLLCSQELELVIRFVQLLPGNAAATFVTAQCCR